MGLSLGGLVVGTLAAPTASASTGHAAASQPSSVVCLPGDGLIKQLFSDYVRDPGPTAAEVRVNEARFEAAFDALSSAERQNARGGGKRVRIPVYVHAIQKRKGMVRGPRKRIKQQIRIMNRAYRGVQSKRSVRTKFRFVLKDIDRRVNKRWYHAALDDPAAKRMKRKVRRGGRRALNIYLTAPRVSGGTLFGWSTFPSDFKKHPWLDGVVIHYGSMRNGRFDGYNKGDTAVHEVGHWLGLYHTFQGGCSKRNDRVRDTPREKTPNYTCPKHRNTCRAPGRDPVHNFLDYSYDNCMNRFTFGQRKRMNRQWAAFRAR